MHHEILLPKFDQSMEEASIESWKVNVGDPIEKGQVLCEIATDKAVVEVESNMSGVLDRILVREGETVAVNTVIAIVSESGEQATDEKPKNTNIPCYQTESAISTPSKLHTLPVMKSQPTLTAGEKMAVPLEQGFIAPGKKAISPKAKKLAEKMKIPVLAVTGSGPDGAIRTEDVFAYYEQINELRFGPIARDICLERNVDIRIFNHQKDKLVTKEMAEHAPCIRGGLPEPLNLMRSTIAKRLSLSKRTTPHFYLNTVVDMTNAVELRNKLDKKVSFTDLLIKAAGLALRKYPRVVSVFTDDGIVFRDHINIGFAVALENEGLVVPVIKDADILSLEEISIKTEELIAASSSNRLSQKACTGGVFTISNLGMYNVDEFIAIINPGESAILAVASITDTPVAINGNVVIRPLMKITLSSDHRVIDGTLAAQFNGYIKSLLESPNQLI